MKRFFGCCNLVFWPETFALYNTIPSPDGLREQFSGLLRACFATVPNGIEHKLQRTQKIGNLLRLADPFCPSICAADLLLRISILRAEPKDAHDWWPPFALTAAFYFCLTCAGCKRERDRTETPHVSTGLISRAKWVQKASVNSRTHPMKLGD